MIYKNTNLDELELTDKSITQRVFEGLDLHPGGDILIDGPSGRGYTADAMREMVQRLAGGLAERGYTGKVIAVMAPNIPEYFGVFHGIAWAGGTITTINPTYTAEEVAYQLRDSGAEMLITVAPFLEVAREGAAGTNVKDIVVIGDAQGATSLSALMGTPMKEQAPVDVLNDIVVMPYSSGTTGRPKGVMLTHRNLVSNVDQMLSPGDIKAGTKTVAVLPFFHIYGMNVLLNTFVSAGAGLVTMPRFDLPQFLELTQDHKAVHAYLVPPIVLALAKHPIVDNYDLSALERIVSGAAPLGAELTNACAERLGCEIAQGYGMTELSPVSHLSQDEFIPGSAGKAVASTECRIVDPETLEDAAEGELWVRGPQVMKGYLNNPEATARDLVDGWLRTGDLGSIDEDGNLFIHDRLKELIKVKGFQVAPAELEALLLSHPAIVDAAVIGKPDEESGEVPLAFIVAAPGSDLDAGAVMSHIAGHLAHYKHLQEVRFVESVPKSASGKILRRLLRDELAAET